MRRFNRVRNIRRNVVRQEPVRTLAQDRPLTSDERELAEHLLRYTGLPEAQAFISQLDHARVTGKCSCGCPTIDLTVPLEFRVDQPPVDRLIVDATGGVNGKVVGVMIFQSQGLLSLLEVYRLEDFSDDPFGLPSPETIEPLVWKDVPAKPDV